MHDKFRAWSSVRAEEGWTVNKGRASIGCQTSRAMCSSELEYEPVLDLAVGTLVYKELCEDALQTMSLQDLAAD